MPSPFKEDQLFAVDKNWPFLFYHTYRDYRADAAQRVTLCAATFPVTPSIPFDDWFTDVDVGQCTSVSYLFRCLSNEIARMSRRGAGNIAFVQNQVVADQLLKDVVDRQWIDAVHVVPEMDPQEMRCAYWKRPGTGLFHAADGGVQITPDGHVYNAAFHQYFTRAKSSVLTEV